MQPMLTRRATWLVIALSLVPGGLGGAAAAPDQEDRAIGAAKDLCELGHGEGRAWTDALNASYPIGSDVMLFAACAKSLSGVSTVWDRKEFPTRTGKLYAFAYSVTCDAGGGNTNYWSLFVIAAVSPLNLLISEEGTKPLKRCGQ
jgi:hypothetical protein